MRKNLLVLAAMIFLFACNDSDDVKTAADNSAGPDTAVEETDGESTIEQSFSSLFTYLKSQDSSFMPDRFTESEGARLSGMKALPIEDNTTAFAVYFIYNSDSSLAIDLYSNNYILSKTEGRETLQRGGPDTQVDLIDLKHKTERRLLFTGPSVYILDAKWASDSAIMIAGAEEINGGRVKPVLWKINLPDSTMQLYSYPDTLNAKAHLFTEEKFEEQKL